jgi:hypothetical protein
MKFTHRLASLWRDGESLETELAMEEERVAAGG